MPHSVETLDAVTRLLTALAALVAAGKGLRWFQRGQRKRRKKGGP